MMGGEVNDGNDYYAAWSIFHTTVGYLTEHFHDQHNKFGELQFNLESTFRIRTSPVPLVTDQ
jgi:hypothetical protein